MEQRHLIRRLLMSAINSHQPAADDAPMARADQPHGMSPHAGALEVALGAWADHVEEPPGRGHEVIDEMIRGEYGLGWPTADAIHWERGAAYERNGQFAWCGAFAAWALGHCGLRPEIRYRHMASCSRLHAFAARTARAVALNRIEPGDVVVVGDGKKKQGDHVTLAIEVVDGLVYTVEGNARGLLPDGKIGEGVVKRTRPLPTAFGGAGQSSAKCPVSKLPQRMAVRWAYRFGPADF